MPQLCPSCRKSTQFKAVISRPGVVDTSKADATIISEGQKFVFEARSCFECGAAVTNTQLIDAEYCADTNVLYPKSELIETNGRWLSKPAHALATRAELQGLSQHDLIAKLLELEAANGKAPVKAAQAQTTAAIEETAAASEVTEAKE